MSSEFKKTMKEVPFTYEDKDYELWWLILHVRRAMRKIRAKELWQYGITPEESAVLVAVKGIGDEATPARIARRLLREPHSISTLLSRMEKKGLVRKDKDLERKNLVRVTLTERGLKLISNRLKESQSTGYYLFYPNRSDKN